MRVLFVGGAEEAWPSMVLNEAGQALSRSVHGPVQQATQLEPVLLVAPGCDVSARWIQIEARSEAQARAAALFALEDQLGGPKEGLHLALGPAIEGGHRLVLITAQQLIAAWLGGARQRGFEARGLVPDYLLLPEPETDSALGLKFGALLAVRARKLAFSAEPPLARQVLGVRPLRVVEDPAQAQTLLARIALAPLEIDLLQAQFARKAQRENPNAIGPSRMAIIGMIAALALIAPLPDVAAGIRYHVAAQAANQRAAALAKQIAPGAPSSLDPVSLVRARLQTGAAPKVAGFAAISANLFAALEQASNVQLDSLAYAPDGDLRATLNYGAFGDIEQLRAALAATGLVLEEGAATNRNERFSVDVRIRSAS